MSDEPLNSKVGLDITDYQNSISEMQRGIRVLESNFRANAAALGDWAQNASGLEMRIDSLTGQIDLQQKKVAALKEIYAKVAEEKGANSKAAQDLEIRINKETEKLNKLDAELSTSQTALEGMGSESADAGEKVEDLGKKEEETSEKTGKFSGAMDALQGVAKAAIGVIAGLAAAVAGVTTAVAALVLKSSEAAGELSDLSAKTGLTTTQLQEMAYVGEQLGVSTETMTGSMAKIIRSMDDARSGSGEMSDAFNALGVSVTDQNGNLRDSQTVWQEALAALGEMSNSSERDALAMQIFGKSAQELNPLIKAGADEINKLTEEANKNGAVMSEDAVSGLAAFDDKLAGLKMGLQGTLGTLASAFLPMFDPLLGQAQGWMQEFSGIVTGSGGDFGKMAEGLGGLVTEIVNSIAGQLPALMQTGMTIIQSILNAIIAALPTLVPAAVGIITSLVQFLIQNIPLIFQAGIDLVMGLINGIVPQLPMILTMAVQMIVTLIQGIAEALPQLLEMAATILPEIIIALIEALPMLIEAAIQLILALVDGLVTALPILIEYIPEIIQSVLDAILTALPILLEAAVELISTLISGLTEAIPMLIEMAPDIIVAVFDALIEALPMIAEAAVELVTTLITGIGDMLPELGQAALDIIDALVNGIDWQKLLDMGTDMVNGIWDGIKTTWDTLTSNVGELFTGLIDWLKKLLGIASPSKVFSDIGSNMALGIGVGFANSFKGVRSQINGALGTFGASMSPVFVGAGAGGRVVNFNQYNKNYNDLDYRKIAIQVKKVLDYER